MKQKTKSVWMSLDRNGDVGLWTGEPLEYVPGEYCSHAQDLALLELEGNVWPRIANLLGCKRGHCVELVVRKRGKK